ncbi:15-hydroxyprostaglandin dehydrogenase (nad(+)) [Moniliophthora roreri MCA 2997]|uniref:15-hydroxyprostaglandin dehydrogenase (Nad(+)) n=1 Tax=Moniliophthora roreri (strain MCA 2997) TaxID=1381753 RepID=V2WVW2_MONRO|nr:15-hydroxyprostaglandin dehydrogenase (nad(+)) [Moniliophthora roreri MCA 2997]
MTNSSTQTAAADVAGDVAFVTGAASGIGLALTKELVRLGARVILVDLNGTGASKVADELNGTAGETVAIAVKTDITSWDQQVAAYELGQKTFGRVDYFIANAGIGEIPWIPKFDPSTAKSRPITEPNTYVTEVNLMAQLHTAALAFQVFERQEFNRHGFRGKLVFTSSLYGIFPSMCQPIYSAAKGGLVDFMRASAEFYADKALTINVICPSLVSTGIQPPVLFQEFYDLNMLTPVEAIVHQYISLLGASKDNGKVICIYQNKAWEQPLEPRNSEDVSLLLSMLERKWGQMYGYWE